MLRTSSHATLLGLATLAALGLAAATPQLAHAQIPILVTGNYDNNPNPPNNGDGYDAGLGADANANYLVDNATFQNDTNNGFDVEGNATVIAGPNVTVSGEPYGFVGHTNSKITINGGTYDYGVYSPAKFPNNTFPAGKQGLGAATGSFGAGQSATMTINGGDFSHDDQGVNTSGPITLTVNGGTFTNDNTGIGIFGGAVSIYGGVYGGNINDFYGSNGYGPSSFVNFYGQFNNPDTGQPMLPGQTFPLYTYATFTGQLLNEATPQTFKYQIFGGDSAAADLHRTGNLVDVAVAPEPSQFAAMGLGILGLGGLAFKARKRSTVA